MVNQQTFAVFQIGVLGTNFTGAKRNETKFYFKETVQNKTKRNFSIVTDLFSSSFKNSLGGGKWPFDLFNAARM